MCCCCHNDESTWWDDNGHFVIGLLFAGALVAMCVTFLILGVGAE